MGRFRVTPLPVPRSLAIAIICSLLGPLVAAHAGNFPVCVLPGDQGAPTTIADGAGGMIVVWQDSRSTPGIYAQRLGAAGLPQWTPDGVPVCAVPGIHSYPSAVSDQAGGVIVAWIDVRAGAADYDIYVQRISAAGLPQWTPDGVALCTAAGDQVDQRIVPDGVGGAIVTWADVRNGASHHVYARRIDASGTPRWTADGVAVCTASGTPSFVLGWGSHGSGPTQLNAPTGVAIDVSGDVYVADEANHRILKFDLQGNLALQWGSFGSGDSQFNLPTGVATDAAGNVYVADLGNNRIVKFTSTGGYLTQWGGAGTGNGRFSSPTGVATDAAGNVYVADNANHRIQKFTDTGGYLTQWGSPGGGIGQFSAPFGVGTDGAGNVYVADQSNNRIQKFTSTGAYLAQWGGAGGGNGQLSLPTGVAVDAVGNVYVADRGNQRIQEFTSAGGYVTQWGTFGSGSGQFSTPLGLAIDASGDLLVADTGNDRIQRFATLPAGEQFNPTIASDDAGGAIITWRDSRSRTNTDIYAQRIDATGAPRWTADGVALCTAAGDQFDPAVVADGAHGAIVAWADYRGGAGADLYVRRIDAGGAPLWTADGVPLCTAPGEQYAPSPDGQGIVPDGAGGAVTAWQDGRNGNDDDIYAQRIGATGTVLWPANGVALCTAADFQIHPRIVPDGGGGAIATWYDSRSGTSADIYAQRIDAAGAPQWTADGVALCTEPGDQQSPRIVPDGVGGAIVAWPDYRSGTSWDLYAQHVNPGGALAAPGGPIGGTPRVLGLAAPRPNPAAGATTLEYTLSRTGHVRLALYDVAGRRVQMLRDGEMSGGAHHEAVSLRDPAGRELASGLYLVRLEAEGRVLTRRLALVH
jgi:DNA-binding beta-propeller fold protein YncE